MLIQATLIRQRMLLGEPGGGRGEHTMIIGVVHLPVLPPRGTVLEVWQDAPPDPLGKTQDGLRPQQKVSFLVEQVCIPCTLARPDDEATDNMTIWGKVTIYVSLLNEQGGVVDTPVSLPGRS